MNGHFRKMRGHYIALIIITIIIIILSITWVYQIVSRSLGAEIALVALTFTLIIVIAFIVRGIIYASQLDGFLRGQAIALRHPPKPGTTIEPFEIKLFKLVLFRYPEVPFEFKVETQSGKGEVFQLEPCVRRRNRGKQPRFPKDKIRKAVLKWEKRDRDFSARTLEEFLDQEFGTGSDGILLMAPTTFYGWRTRILDEINAAQPPAQNQQ
jgi:hypothetical protein